MKNFQCFGLIELDLEMKKKEKIRCHKGIGCEDIVCIYIERKTHHLTSWSVNASLNIVYVYLLWMQDGFGCHLNDIKAPRVSSCFASRELKSFCVWSFFSASDDDDECYASIWIYIKTYNNECQRLAWRFLLQMEKFTQFTADRLALCGFLQGERDKVQTIFNGNRNAIHRN